MKLKGIIVGLIVAIFLGTSQLATASTGFTGDDFTGAHSQRPPINTEFDPDESCLFDVYQKQCIPGSEQECPRPQFGNNEDYTCFPKTFINGTWDWECPEGYHSEDDDETGQCYPNDKGCSPGLVLITSSDSGDKLDRCADMTYLCDEEEYIKEDYCIEFCKERQDAEHVPFCRNVLISTGEEIIYDKNADLPICVYKEIKDCKTKSGLICEVETTIDPCQDIFHGFTGTDENYKLETNQFIVPNVYASEDPFHTNQGNRPAINPEFDPDFDCIYDVSQIHCIPGSAQECPKPQFSAGDPEMCFPKTLVNGEWEWKCPEDYHSVQDDETGQCYPDSEGCPDGTIMKEFENSDGHGCSEYKINCNLNEDHRLCNGEERTDGIKVCDQPDHPGYKFCNGEN